MEILKTGLILLSLCLPLQATTQNLPREYLAVQAHPHSPRALSSLGMYYYRAGAYREALQLYLLAEKEGGPSGFLYQMQGRSWQKLGRPDLSLEPLEKGLKLSPHDAWLHSSLAQSYYLLGRYQDSLESWTQALRWGKKDPSSLSFTYSAMAKCYREMNAWDSSREYFEKAAAYRDGFWIHYEWAGLWQDRGDPEQAALQYHMARKLEQEVEEQFRILVREKEARAWFDAAWEARSRQDWAGAGKFLQRILEDEALSDTAAAEKARFWIVRIPR